MQTAIRYILLFLVVTAAPYGYGAADEVSRGTLHADGILTVKGGDVSDAMITIIPADAPAYTLNKGTKRFDLTFMLNKTYLVIFEHPQCLTKQLYFDTTVPADYRSDEYQFPFEVVLEVVPRTTDRSYVGPVGYIRYLDVVNDFDYVTDYTIQIDERIKQRMVRPTTVPSSTQVSPAYERTPQEAQVSERHRPIPSSSSMEEVDPVTKQPEPVVEAPIEREPAPGPLEPLVAETIVVPEKSPEPVSAEIVDVPVRMDDPMPAPGVPPVIKAFVEKPPASTYSPPARGVARKYVAPDPMKFGRHEQLIVEDNRVTTKVNIVNELGYGIEYRRVAHHYGPVFYFKDEQSITKDVYYEETGMPME